MSGDNSSDKIPLILTECSIEDAEYLDIDHPCDGWTGKKKYRGLNGLDFNIRHSSSKTR